LLIEAIKDTIDFSTSAFVTVAVAFFTVKGAVTAAVLNAAPLVLTCGKLIELANDPSA
jgi:hypothetical protein